MRTTLTALIAFALVLAACGATNPGKPSPTVLGTQAPSQPTEAPMPHY
jgi:hypothetical protein